MPSSLTRFLRTVLGPSEHLGALRIVLIISFLVGIVPCGLLVPNNLPYIAYCTTVIRICILAFIFCHAIHFTEPSSVHFFSTDISRLLDILQKLSGMMGVITAQGIALLKRKQLKKIIIVLKTIEDRLYNLGITFNQRKYTLVFSFYIGSAFIVNLLLIIVSVSGWELKHKGFWPSISSYIACFAPNGILTGVVLLSTCLNYKISSCFKANNKVLKNLSNQWENRKIRSISDKSRSLNCLDSFSMDSIVTRNPCDIIEESMEIHQMICEAASTANNYFTYQLLTIISIAFLIIVFDAYYVLETLLGKSNRESKFKTVEFVSFFSCQMILYLIAIISIVEGSNRAIKKSEKTGGIIHSLLSKAKNPEVKQKLQQFSMQLVHLKINFTAAGLFNIDRTLYFTISGALTTYLIILLQYTSTSPSTKAQCIFMQNITNATIVGN